MISQTTIPHGVNNYYDRNMLRRAKPALYHTKFVQVRDLPKNETDKIKFRRYGVLSAVTTPLVEGVTPDAQDASTSDITATIEEYGAYFIITSKVKMTTLDPLLSELSGVLGDQMGLSLDTIAREVFNAGTNVQFAGGRTVRTDVASTDVLDIGEFQKAYRTMQSANAPFLTSRVNADTGYATSPVDSAYYVLINPMAVKDVQSISGFTPVEKYASKANVLPTEIGSFGNFRFITSTNTKIFAGGGSSSIDVYTALVFAQDAVGISRISGEAMRTITKAVGSSGVADALDQRGSMGWKATFAAVILNQSWLLRIEHAISSIS